MKRISLAALGVSSSGWLRSGQCGTRAGRAGGDQPAASGAAAAADSASAADSAADVVQDQGAGLSRQDRRSGGPGAGDAVVREHRQPADGSLVRLPAALRRGDRPDDVHGRWQGVRRQAADAKDEARRIYEGYVRRNQDPALLEWVGYGMFQTSVFPVPPGAERKVSLKFSQLLRKDQQLTDLIIPALDGQVHVVAGREALDSRRDRDRRRRSRASIARRTRSTCSGPTTSTPSSSSRRRTRSRRPTSACSTTRPTASSARASSATGPTPSDDGYFLLLASPEIKAASDERPAKTVIFVVDRSGSMSGKKIEQAKEALKFVLNNLRQGDTFNIVAYDSNGRKLSSPSCRSTTTRPARRPSASSKASMPAAARTSTGR